jgi:pimeloyl-ACP methyl ester carboxylesterase
MNLVDRYLHEVGFFLPKTHRHDILAELSEGIHSQVEEREAELGHPLNDAELEEILDRWGKPLLVAERYLPDRHLIGPVLYPVYTLVLKIVALTYLLPWLLVWAGLMLFSSTYRGEDPFSGLNALWSWWSIVVNCFFFITIGFAYMERYTLSGWLAQGWNPRQPPAVSDPNQLPLASSVLDLALNTIFAGWWLKLGLSKGMWTNEGGNGEITLAPIWQTLYWPIFLLFVAGIVLAVLSIFRPYRTQLHNILSLARAGYGAVLIVVLAFAGTLLEITAAGENATSNVEHVELWLNRSLRLTLAIIGIACFWDVYRNALRFRGGRRPSPAAIALSMAALLITVTDGAFATSPKADFFDSNGVKIHFLEEGQGEAVVLIHGFAANAEMWSAIRPKLAEHYRVVAFDCRGHGKSDKPYDPRQHGRETVEDVVRLLDHLQIRRAHVAGYSMGAEIAGHLLVRHPDRLQSVTLGGGAPSFEPTKESRAREELAANSLEAGKGIGPMLMASAPPGGLKLTPQIADAISQMIIGDQDQKALAASIRGGMTLEVTADELRSNRLPVLVIYGSQDGERASQKRLTRVAKLLGAQVTVIEGGDHLSTLGRPEFLAAVQKFIDAHHE